MTTEELDKIRKNLGVDVGILAKYYPIEEVGLRAFDNNLADIERYAKNQTRQVLDRLMEQKRTAYVEDGFEATIDFVPLDNLEQELEGLK